MARTSLTPIVLPADPTANLQAATKQYVDNASGAGTTMTSLTAQTGSNAVPADIIETVDISDTTMASSGTNKKITLAEFINFLKLNGLALTVVKQTQPVAADYGLATIPVGAVWVQSP